MLKPRLLVLASTFPARSNDGTPAFVRDLALQEAERFETLVLVPAVPGGAAEERDGELLVRRFRFFPKRWETLADGAILENLRSRPSSWLQVPAFFIAQHAAIRRAVREFQPDVLHVHWIIPQGIVARLAAPGVPQLVTTLGGDLYALNAAPLRALKSWVVRRAAAVTVMNVDMLDRVRSLGARTEDSEVIPMGADVAGMRELAPRAGDSGGPLLLAFVGRLVPKKGLGVLFDAIRRLGPDAGVTLEVVGDGPLRAELERQAEGLDVTFLGQLGRPDLAQVYARAAVVVAPSVPAASGDRDGLPVALIEAMGMGCAVIASNVAGLNEAVTDGKNGILVEPGDAAGLADAIARLRDDPATRLRFADAARAVGEEHSVPAIGRRYRALLERLIVRR